MENEEYQKSIIISLENWKKLSRWKIELNCSNMDDLISRMIKIISLEELENKKR